MIAPSDLFYVFCAYTANSKISHTYFDLSLPCSPWYMSRIVKQTFEIWSLPCSPWYMSRIVKQTFEICYWEYIVDLYQCCSKSNISNRHLASSSTCDILSSSRTNCESCMVAKCLMRTTEKHDILWLICTFPLIFMILEVSKQ